MASVDGMITALRRAAHVIQGCHAALAKGINGEAIIALATAIQRGDEPWSKACERAEEKLAKEWPHSVRTSDKS